MTDYRGLKRVSDLRRAAGVKSGPPRPYTSCDAGKGVHSSGGFLVCPYCAAGFCKAHYQGHESVCLLRPA